MKDKAKDIKDFFNNLSDEEFKELLLDTGFEVEKGSGYIIYEDSLTWSFTISPTTQPYRYKDHSNVGVNIKYPNAC